MVPHIHDTIQQPKQGMKKKFIFLFFFSKKNKKHLHQKYFLVLSACCSFYLSIFRIRRIRRLTSIVERKKKNTEIKLYRNEHQTERKRKIKNKRNNNKEENVFSI